MVLNCANNATQEELAGIKIDKNECAIKHWGSCDKNV